MNRKQPQRFVIEGAKTDSEIKKLRKSGLNVIVIKEPAPPSPPPPWPPSPPKAKSQ